MTSDVLLVAWHGVEGDTATWWATTGPLSNNALPKINANHHFQANSFAGPAVDPSAHLVASVGATAPSLITLQSVDSNGDISGPGPLVPTTTDFHTDARPAVTTTSWGNVALAWRHFEDHRIRFSAQLPIPWQTPVDVGGVSEHGPAIAAITNDPFRRVLVAFQGVEDWKGKRDQIRGSINGGTQFAMTPHDGGMFTSHAPALCADVDFFWMAWKGGSDENIWLSRSPDGVFWTEPHTAQPIKGGINTIAGPGLAVR